MWADVASVYSRVCGRFEGVIYVMFRGCVDLCDVIRVLSV